MNNIFQNTLWKNFAAVIDMLRSIIDIVLMKFGTTKRIFTHPLSYSDIF